MLLAVTGAGLDLSQLPGLGAFGVLVGVVGYLLASNRADRAQYRKDIAELDARHIAEVGRLQSEITALRGRVDTLEREVDSERDERRRAEDRAASAERRAVHASGRLDELDRLTRGVGDDQATAG